MNRKSKLLPALMVLGLCTHCVTPKAGVALSEDQKVSIVCKYIGMNRLRDISDVECSIENRNSAPARIKLEKIELDDPHAQIIPADVSRIGGFQTLQNVVVILGVVIIIVALVAIATKSKNSYLPNVHLSAPYSPLQQTVSPAVVTSSGAPFIDTIEIPAYNHAILAFRAQHGLIRPATLVIHLDNRKTQAIRVPIESQRGRSEF